MNTAGSYLFEPARRLSVRALGRELDCSADDLEEIVAELVEVQGVAAREGGVLVHVGAEKDTARPRPEVVRPPTPGHLADKIMHSKSALEGERKQVTVLFADVQGSMELAQQLDPEAWSQIMQRFFTMLAAGVERFEGFGDKFTGDGIMAPPSRTRTTRSAPASPPSICATSSPATRPR